MTIYSIFIFRKKYPDVRRPYRAWLYPYSIVIVLLLLLRVSRHYVDYGFYPVNARAGADFFRDDILLSEN